MSSWTANSISTDGPKAFVQGRAYVSDGMSHLLDFNVGGVEVGQKESELRLDAQGTVAVRAKVSALLDVTPIPTIKNMPVHMRPVWHLERARIGATRPSSRSKSW
jgi:hypothetical protein